MGKVIVWFLAQPSLNLFLRETFWHWVGLLGVLVVLILIVLRVKAWLREDDDLANDDHAMLREISELQRRGALSPEEYRSIKGRLIERLQNQDAETDETVAPREPEGSPQETE